MHSAQRFQPREFLDYFGNDCSGEVQVHRGRSYLVRTSRHEHAARADYLGYRLAKNIFNVPEVIAPHDALSMMGMSVPGYPVRVCQDYLTSALPIRDLSTAVAAELVFSTWINRRDAHNSNRVYVGGIPMFFDFGEAFNWTEVRSGLDFFRSGSDSGYVANWRIWEIPKDDVVQTTVIRDLERGKPLALHPVHDVGRFWTGIEHYVEIIRNLEGRFIEDTVADCHFDDAVSERLVAFLVTEKDELDRKMERVRTILKADAPVRHGQPSGFEDVHPGCCDTAADDAPRSAS